MAKQFIKVYTRKATGEEYPSALANSVHMAICTGKERELALNQNYGILFSKAKIREDNTLEERGIRSPKVLKKSEYYYIYAEQIKADGKPVTEGEAPFVTWRTTDFIEFEECEGELCREEAREQISIPDSLVPAIRQRWIPLQAESVTMPEKFTINNLAELEKIRATVTYTDGSVDRKPICWDKHSLCKTSEDTYEIKGCMEAVDTSFPLTVGLADPVIFLWEDRWYYIATNDKVDDIGLFVRQADSVRGLFDEGVETTCILDYDEKRGFCQTFWAPEFHVIGGRLYILFAVSNQNWGPQCHMMRLKQGGHIMNPDDWEEPVRVRTKDDRFLTEKGITLDMTYFQADGISYLVWSYRYGIGTPLDTGSMLYIASTDPNTPWVLTSEPVLLSRPLYGWENQSGTINNEGPYALILDDKIYLSYSGGAACGCSYVVGYLKASVGDDLLNADVWKKEPTAVLHLLSIEGIQGPGHNSFFYDEKGRLMIAYHAQERKKYFCRCSAYHRVHLSKSGFPLLNVAGERDLPSEKQEVTWRFCMKEAEC